MTIQCPLDCEYLLEARLHEKPVEIDKSQVPNLDIHITEEFIEKIDPLLKATADAIQRAANQVPGACDRDVREALEAMIKTLRTRQSGLIYETRPANPLAGMLQQHVQALITEFVENARRELGLAAFRDADTLGALTFFQRLAIQMDNGRPLGKSFLSTLLRMSPAADQELPQPAQASLLLP